MSNPKIGDVVECPPDRGAPGYTGTVTYVGRTPPQKNSNWGLYVWVTVQHPSGHKCVWPSNRLGYKLDLEEWSRMNPTEGKQP